MWLHFRPQVGPYEPAATQPPLTYRKGPSVWLHHGAVAVAVGQQSPSVSDADRVSSYSSVQFQRHSEWVRTARVRGVVRKAAPAFEAACKRGPRATGTLARLTANVGVPATPASGLINLQNNPELRQTLYFQFVAKDTNKHSGEEIRKAGGDKGR